VPRSKESQAEYLKNRANSKWATYENKPQKPKTSHPMARTVIDSSKKFKNDLFEDL